MTHPLLHSLQGRMILLLAEPPLGAGQAWEDDALELAFAEAAAGLARTVFRRGGRLAVVGDETIALLAAMVAGDYLPAARAEDPRAERDEMPSVVYFAAGESQPSGGEPRRDSDETGGVEMMVTVEGLARLRRRSLPGENPAAFLADSIRPAGIVAIGSPRGAFGLLSDFADFLPASRRYALSSTGTRGDVDRVPAGWRNVEAELAERLLQHPRRTDSERERGFNEIQPESPRIPYVPPYPLLTQIIADEIAGDLNRLL